VQAAKLPSSRPLGLGEGRVNWGPGSRPSLVPPVCPSPTACSAAVPVIESSRIGALQAPLGIAPQPELELQAAAPAGVLSLKPPPLPGASFRHLPAWEILDQRLPSAPEPFPVFWRGGAAGG